MRHSINQQFADAEAIIQNILRSKDMQKYFATYGFPLARIKEGQARLKAAREFQTIAEELRTMQYDANQQWKENFKQSKRSYQDYVTLTRLAFQQDPVALRHLRLDRPTPTRLQEWLDQARHFYTHVPVYQKVLEQRFGLKAEVWSQALIEIHALIAFKHERLHHKANAQQATEQRDQGLRQLSEWIRELKHIARVALKETPQLQEALGIVTK